MMFITMTTITTLILFLLILPTGHALFINTTTIGVEVLPTADPDSRRSKYITSWISTPTIQVRWGATPATVRNATLLAILKEEDWIAHRQGLHNKSCIDGSTTHFIPGCEKPNIQDCPTQGKFNLTLPKIPGTYLIVAYSNNGSHLPYYLDNHGSSYLENEYIEHALAAGTLQHQHRDNSSILCYQWWLRPPINSTTEGWIFLGNQMMQMGQLSRIYNAPSFWATVPTLTMLEGGGQVDYTIFYESGNYLRSPLFLQTLSNCYHLVKGGGTGGIWSQTTMHTLTHEPPPRQMRLLTINNESDVGLFHPFLITEDNTSASIRISVQATNNLHQSKFMNTTCSLKHWITPMELYSDAIWSPARLTPQLKRDYQPLPVDGSTPFIEIPLILIDDEYLHNWLNEKTARTIGTCGALLLTFVLCTRLLSILWYNFFDLTDLRDANNMLSVRGEGATRLDVTELGSQRHYIISAWPFIWLLQSIAMCSQLKIVQEHVGLYGVMASIATTPVYLIAVPLPIPTMMVEPPPPAEDQLQRDLFVGQKIQVDPPQGLDEEDDTEEKVGLNPYVQYTDLRHLLVDSLF